MAACSFIALLTNCPDAIIVDGLLPINTNIVYTIRDKFDNITTVEVTTDGDGKFTVDPALFPLGIFNDFAGTFELLVYANVEDATNLENQLGLTLCDVEHFSVVFSFTESEAAGAVIPNCDQEQPVDDNTDIPCVTNPIDAFCKSVRICLGISATANIDLFLNRRGQWVEISGGAVDSVNGQTGVVVLDADDIDDTTTSNKFVTQTQINTWNALIGGSIFQTVWNATTNTPTLSSGVGTKGYYYIVNVTGGTNLDGITDWKVGDWAIFDGTVWRKVDNTDAVSSVNGQTGAVSLTAANVGAPSGSGTSTGTNTGDQDLSGLQGKRIVVSGNTIAVNDAAYTLTANAIFADPTGVNGKGYSVLIRNGTATIGVTTYSTAGTLIWRVFNAGSWATYVLTNQTQLDLKKDKPITLNLSGDVTTTSASSTAITGLVATLEANTNYIITGVLRSRCSGAGGVKYGMTLVSGATSNISAQGKGALSGSTISLEEYFFNQSGTLTATGLIRVATALSDIYLNGNINVGATAGTIQFNFASATGGQTSTIDQLGTWIEIKKA